MEHDEKLCPRCAETVKAAALVCKHCTYEFGKPINTSSKGIFPAPLEAKKKRPFMVGCLSLAGMIFVIGLIGSQLTPSNNLSSSGSNASAPEALPVAVNSVNLARAYSNNEVAAQRTFADKTLDVTGIVTGVTLDFANNPVLQLEGVNQFLPVQATFDKRFKQDLAAFSKGESVTVRCTSITEVISAPMLSDCSIP